MSACGGTGCGRPTRDVLRLCEQCLWEIERALSEMPALLDELQTTITRQAVMAEAADKIRGTNGQPLPYHVQASACLADLRVCLVGWTRDLAGDDPAKYPTDDLAAIAGWLLHRLNDIATHPATDDIYAEIVGTVREAWRVVDKAANRTRFPIGPCPESPCPGEVWAYIPTSEDRPARLECRACSTRWETHQWLRAGKRILARMDSSSTQRQRLLDSA